MTNWWLGATIRAFFILFYFSFILVNRNFLELRFVEAAEDQQKKEAEGAGGCCCQ